MRASIGNIQARGSPGLDDRGMYWPRGRVVGGSSSINAMVYCRGMPADFDDWRASRKFRLGLGRGASLLRAIRASRRCRRAGAHGRCARRQGCHSLPAPMRREWLEAAAELKLPVTDDFNGPHPEGFGSYQVSIRDGRRWSSADAFLRPALKRGNVKLVTGAWASKLRCEGRRVSGVEFFRDNERHFVAADREVIVCAGTVNSPQLLQLSGIGPGRLLSEHGLETVLDNPAVGGNLQDHLAVVYSFKASRPTLNDELHSRIGRMRRGRSVSVDPHGSRELERQSLRRVRARQSASLAARRAAVFQSGHLSGGRCDAHAHPARRIFRVLSMFSADPPDQHRPHRSRERRLPHAPGHRARIISPPRRTSPTSFTAAGCCRRSPARGLSKASYASRWRPTCCA